MSWCGWSHGWGGEASFTGRVLGMVGMSDPRFMAGVGYICWRARRVVLGSLEQSLGVWANDYQPRKQCIEGEGGEVACC